MQVGFSTPLRALALLSTTHNVNHDFQENFVRGLEPLGQGWRADPTTSGQQSETAGSQISKAIRAPVAADATKGLQASRSWFFVAPGFPLGGGGSSIHTPGHPSRRATDCILALCVVLHILQHTTRGRLTSLGQKVNHLIRAGQVWRLVAPTFLHADLMHLLVNCWSLHNLGPHLEALTGTTRFLAVFFLSAVGCFAASARFTRLPSIGMSGAVFGVGAALAVYYARHRDLMPGRSDDMLTSLGLCLALNVGYAFFGRNLDHWGHIGGLLGGAAAAWVLGPRYVRSGAYGRLEDKPPWKFGF